MPDETPDDVPVDLKVKLLDAALVHVPFDGWSEATLAAAAKDVGIGVEQARALFPRAGVDLAAAYHNRGDAAMLELMQLADFSALRYSEKVGEAIKIRLRVAGDKEVVRAATTLFALPVNAPEGARLIWGTADAIWNALGDTSDDINWYSKRLILSGVYGSSVLYWLGDKSEGDADTWAFVDRRIENVMQFEKLKTQVRANPVLGKLLAVPEAFLGGIRAPKGHQRDDLPGHWAKEEQDSK